MNQAVSEQVTLSPAHIKLGEKDRGRGKLKSRNNSTIALYKFVLPTIFGNFHKGYEYVDENNNNRLPPYREWNERQYRAVKSFMIHKYERRGGSGEDPDNEIRIKAHVEARSSIDVAFDNHVILPDRILSNANQTNLRDNREKYYFALYPLARGGDIFEAIHESFSTEDACKLVFRQIFEGVRYLHRLGIFHNDLKPENIVTNTERNIAHIIDFGQAIIVDNASERIEKTGSGYGTSLYCAPELSIEDKDMTFDWRKADIWALGVSLFIMLVKDYPIWTQGGTLIPVDPLSRDFQSLLGSDGTFPDYCRRLPNLTLTENAIDLMHRMLVADVAARISIDDILAHPWLS